mmetsp:Transcript_14839/g.48616  ORF Transcript_14839/g.48616 Transcript_14839/m.48616 type:complete len:219 (+) Transcript_14839:582-1238(+)
MRAYRSELPRRVQLQRSALCVRASAARTRGSARCARHFRGAVAATLGGFLGPRFGRALGPALARARGQICGHVCLCASNSAGEELNLHVFASSSSLDDPSVRHSRRRNRALREPLPPPALSRHRSHSRARGSRRRRRGRRSRGNRADGAAPPARSHGQPRRDRRLSPARGPRARQRPLRRRPAPVVNTGARRSIDRFCPPRTSLYFPLPLTSDKPISF